MANLMNVNPNMAMGPGADNQEGSVNRTYFKHVGELEDASKKKTTDKIVVKAQIQAGGRGKAGGIKIEGNYDELKREAEKGSSSRWASTT